MPVLTTYTPSARGLGGFVGLEIEYGIFLKVIA